MNKDLKRWEKFFLVALFLFMLVAGLAKVAQHTRYGAVDSAGYMGEALEIKDHGGPLNLLERLFLGEYRPAVRQPLYNAILSLVATEDPLFFLHAKLMTLVLAFLGLVISYFVLRKTIGVFEAAGGVLLTALSAVCLMYATIVAVETFMMWWVMLGWWIGIRALREDGIKNALGLGACSAIAYMTKANGHLILLSWLAVGVLLEPKTFWRQKKVYAAVGMFLLTASPLIVRNLLIYKTPLYVLQAPLIWADSFHDYYRPEFMRNPPGFWGYMETHTIHDLLKRFLLGFFDQLYWFGFLTRPAGAPDWLIRPAAVFMNGFFAWGVLQERDRVKKTLVAVFWLGYVAMGTLSTTFMNEPRLYIPMFPLFGAYAVRGVKEFWSLFKKDTVWMERFGLLAGIFILILFSITTVGLGFPRNPFDSVEVNQDVWELRGRLLDVIPEGERFFWGPSHQSLWWTSGRLYMDHRAIPLMADWNNVNAYADEEEIRWMAVSDQENFLRRENLFYDFFSYQEDRGFLLREPPEGWELYEKDQNGDVDWLLFRRTTNEIQ